VIGASYRELAYSGLEIQRGELAPVENINLLTPSLVPIPGFEHFLFFHQPPFRPQIAQIFANPEIIMLKTFFLNAWMVASGFAYHVTPRQGINVDSKRYFTC
jgi:hypothetical protein